MVVSRVVSLQCRRALSFLGDLGPVVQMQPNIHTRENDIKLFWIPNEETVGYK